MLCKYDLQITFRLGPVQILNFFCFGWKSQLWKYQLTKNVDSRKAICKSLWQHHNVCKIDKTDILDVKKYLKIIQSIFKFLENVF
jgi:hypothetical protein